MTAAASTAMLALKAPFSPRPAWAPLNLSSLQSRIGWLGVVIALAITALSLLVIDAGIQMRSELGCGL